MKSVPLAFAYWAAETALDFAVIWILATRDFPWVAVVYAILAGFAANMNVKRYMGFPRESP